MTRLTLEQIEKVILIVPFRSELYKNWFEIVLQDFTKQHVQPFIQLWQKKSESAEACEAYPFA